MPQLSRAGLLNSQSFNNINNTKNLKNMSGKRGSNPRPQPWKGCALPTELFPPEFSRANRQGKNESYVPCPALMYSVGREGFEPPKSSDNRFTVCPSWPLWYLPHLTEHAWLDIRFLIIQ